MKTSRLVLASYTMAAAALLAACGDSERDAHGPRPMAGSPAHSESSVDATRGLLGSSIRATPERTQTLAGGAKLGPHVPKPQPGSGGVAGSGSCANADAMPDGTNLPAMPSAVVCLLNSERGARGLASLGDESRLGQAAGAMARAMVDEGFFSHTTPDGRGLADRVRPTHYLPERGTWVLGENLAWGSGALATPRSIVAGWMNSPGHRANVLDPGYRDIGVIVVPGSPTRRFTGGATYVADFGVRAATPATASAKPVQSVPASIASAKLVRRGIAIPVTCTRPCVIRTRVYLRHTLVGRRVERLRHRGQAKRRIRIFQRFKGRLSRHRHVRLVAVTRVSGTRGARRTVVSVN